jgi:hypothetical protein
LNDVLETSFYSGAVDGDEYGIWRWGSHCFGKGL